MFEKILVPLDRAELSEEIVPFVSQLARGLKVPVVLLAVIDPERAGGRRVGNVVQTGEMYAKETVEELRKEGTAWLEEVAKRLDDDIEVIPICLVSVGEPADEIVRVAEGEGCNLIAMATHGRSFISRIKRESLTDRVTSLADVPTLTMIQKGADDNCPEGAIISKVLVPLDGSRLAETALPYVEHLARNLSLEVVLVQSIKPTGLYTGMDVTQAFEKLAAEYLNRIGEKLQAKGLNVRLQTPHGRPAESIVNLAQETPGIVIALATHGRTGLIRRVMGSVAESVVRSSGNPVLVISPWHTE